MNFFGRHGAWSLASRLTAWYTIASFAIVLAATGFLYLALVRSLDREDDEFLTDEAHVLSDLLRTWPNSRNQIEREIGSEWANREHARVYAHITDSSGATLAMSPGINGILLAALSDVARSGKAGDLQTQPGKHVRVFSQRVDGGAVDRQFRIAIALDRSREEELIASYRRQLFMALVVAMALCAVVGYRLAKRGTKPVRKMGDIVSHINSTKLYERIATEGLPSELLLLAKNFNAMLDRLQDSFSRLSRFSADIAHELRTPINNLRGEIDVALSQDRSPAEYELLLESLQEECIRLTKIVEGLLFMARADHLQAGAVFEEVDLPTEIRRIADFYDPLAKSSGIQLNAACLVESPLLADRGLLQRALANLVDNAISHTPTGGLVTIRGTEDHNSCRIEVIDSGSGIPRESLPHVFDPFFRLHAEHGDSKSSLGLGLSIVNSIAKLHGGSVHIDSELGRGTTVTLHLRRQTRKAGAHGLSTA